MNNNLYIPPYQRALHQSGLRILLLVQFFVVLPFMRYMPAVLYGVFILVALWRWRVQRGELRESPKWVQLSVIGLGILGLYLSGFNHYSLDAAVAVCVLGYLLKSLEILRRRDAIFQIYLGLFLTGVFLLYRFDPIGALIMVGLLFLNLFALQVVTSEGQFQTRYAVKQTAILILAAIPVMVAGYLFFPRLPPLWTMPNEQRGAKTGMTDELTPGSVADLARSQEPAFRVSFSGERPPRTQWYWRGNTMTLFDGKTWKAEYGSLNAGIWPRQSALPEALVQPYDYTVIMESTGRRWLYFLDWPTFVDAQGSFVLPDGRAAKQKPLNSAYRYQAQSASTVSWQDQAGEIRKALNIPEQSNELLKQWAQEQRGQSDSDLDFVADLAQFIRDGNFYYTLKPPLYSSENSLEAFWLGDRRGFCAHYATATTFILRAAGIPARLVGGYMGGTYVPNGDYIQVRQMEAHVWVEFWFQGQWQRFDPTAAVAPERVEINLDDLLLRYQPSDLPVLSRISNLSLINQLSMYWDSLEYQWQVMVLNYDNDTALSWFQSAFGKVTALKLALALLVLLAIVALVVGLLTGMIHWPKRKKEPFKSISRLEKWFGARQPNETLKQYFERIQQQNSSVTTLAELQAYFELLIYQPEAKPNSGQLKRLMNQVAQQRR